MRFHVLALAGALLAGCGLPSPSPAAGGLTAPTAITTLEEPGCVIAVHAILSGAGGIGHIQFRIEPVEGSPDAVVSYFGALTPVSDYSELSAKLMPVIPDSPPVWSDFQKHDPGATLSTSKFVGLSVLNPDVAVALANDPSGYKAVVNVVGTTGGRQAEGLVAPTRDVPEPVRERQRLCFGSD